MARQQGTAPNQNKQTILTMLRLIGNLERFNSQKNFAIVNLFNLIDNASPKSRSESKQTTEW